VAKKLGNHLPDDLAFSILFKLPFKSLKRFGGLYKSWALLFENYHFIDLFRTNITSNRHSYYDDTSILLCFEEFGPDFNTYNLFLPHGERFQHMDKLNFPNLQDDHEFQKLVLGSSSVNGIVCIYQYKNHVYLWNPATGSFLTVQLSMYHFMSYL